MAQQAGPHNKLWYLKLLEPKGITARLQGIKAPQTSTQGTPSAVGGATTPQVSPEDLRDLQPP